VITAPDGRAVGALPPPLIPEQMPEEFPDLKKYLQHLY